MIVVQVWHAGVMLVDDTIYSVEGLQEYLSEIAMLYNDLDGYTVIVNQSKERDDVRQD